MHPFENLKEATAKEMMDRSKGNTIVHVADA